MKADAVYRDAAKLRELVTNLTKANQQVVKGIVDVLKQLAGELSSSES